MSRYYDIAERPDVSYIYDIDNGIRPGLKRQEADMIDRSEVARCLAKAIAYKCCGKDAEAADWARKLIRALELAEILR